jgi:hypothetical protein
MYFCKGDTIENIYSGDKGLIMDVTSHNYSDVTYSVLWNGMIKPLDYQHSAIYGGWRLVTPANSMPNNSSAFSGQVLPTGIDHQGEEFNSVNYDHFGYAYNFGLGTSCQHNWKTYDSGWTRYEYCDKCNVEKKDVQ